MLKDWRHTPAVRRILAQGPLARTHLEFVVDLCDWLCQRGLPLYRVNQYTPTLHPLMQGVGAVWRRDGRHSEEIQPHWRENEGDPGWLASPLRKIMLGTEEIRVDLTEGPAEFGVPILDRLRAEGASEYLVMAVPFADRRRSAVSWATDAPGGFSVRARNELRNLAGPIGLVLDLLEWRRTASTLLDTYLGRGPGRLVLDGAIRRGDHRNIEAVILFADLRDFTSRAMRSTSAQLLAVLDAYFQVLVGAVTAAGGEVLKFMGDGLLAIFPIGTEHTVDQTCIRALDATIAAQQQMAELNRSRVEAGSSVLAFGVGLHVGEVVYGNIGGRGRLDFTVIGRAVNLVSRVEGLCKTLDQTVLATDTFAHHLGPRMVSVGRHAIRGLADPVELYALPDVP